MKNKSNHLTGSFKKAVGKLDDVLKQKKNEYIRDSAIQRFEFTFELAWKVLQANIQEQGLQGNSPREAIKGAFQAGLIDENPLWLRSLELRNLTTPTYNEKTAEEIYLALPALLRLYQNLLKKLAG